MAREPDIQFHGIHERAPEVQPEEFPLKAKRSQVMLVTGVSTGAARRIFRSIPFSPLSRAARGRTQGRKGRGRRVSRGAAA